MACLDATLELLEEALGPDWRTADIAARFMLPNPVTAIEPSPSYPDCARLTFDHPDFEAAELVKTRYTKHRAPDGTVASVSVEFSGLARRVK